MTQPITLFKRNMIIQHRTTTHHFLHPRFGFHHYIFYPLKYLFLELHFHLLKNHLLLLCSLYSFQWNMGREVASIEFNSVYGLGFFVSYQVNDFNRVNQPLCGNRFRSFDLGNRCKTLFLGVKQTRLQEGQTLDGTGAM